MNGTGQRRPGDGEEDARRRRLGPSKPFELIYYYTNDDDIAQKVNQVRKQALEAAGFKVTTWVSPARSAASSSATRRASTNMLQSPAWLVLRLAVR